jgi:hypothetical protein
MKQLLLLIGMISSTGLAPGFAAETTPAAAAATAESPKILPKPGRHPDCGGHLIGKVHRGIER